jgi:transcriptional regulator with XRE-family HTH domain
MEHVDAMVQKDSSETGRSTVSRDSRKDLDRQVGTRIRNLRVLKGWSAQQLAEAVGCTAEQIRKIERGALRIDPNKLISLATALDGTIDALFETIETPGLATVAASDGLPPDFVARRDVMQLVAAFADIGDASLRTSFLRVAERMASLKGGKR